MSSIADRHDLHAQTMLFEQVAKPQNGRFQCLSCHVGRFMPDRL